jgi:hypothetical protein
MMMVTNNREYSICVGSPSGRYQSKIKKTFFSMQKEGGSKEKKY